MFESSKKSNIFCKIEVIKAIVHYSVSDVTNMFLSIRNKQFQNWFSQIVVVVEIYPTMQWTKKYFGPIASMAQVMDNPEEELTYI